MIIKIKNKTKNNLQYSIKKIKQSFMKNKKKFFYPKEVTHNFDYATFHINYCLSFIKKYLKGDILEVGAGNGSFTKNYVNSKINSLILTDKD